MKTSLILSSIIGAGLATAADCPAPGLTDSQGRYSCNPAHNASKSTAAACLFLCDNDGKPVIGSSASSGAAPPASACPAPGLTDSQGRYSCNPAHKYPEGRQCKQVDGCLFLCDNDGKPIIGSSTSGGAPGAPEAPEAPEATETTGATEATGATGTGPGKPAVTAGAATLSGAGLLGLVGLAVALF
ncbi:hypothetical protein E4U30_007204 [Claviceps sp. LM220 group G6]|nr:hypothetical protein E4U30_007204 [Claviceps sp. LM220 group G6]